MTSIYLGYVLFVGYVVAGVNETDVGHERIEYGEFSEASGLRQLSNMNELSQHLSLREQAFKGGASCQF